MTHGKSQSSSPPPLPPPPAPPPQANSRRTHLRISSSPETSSSTCGELHAFSTNSHPRDSCAATTGAEHAVQRSKASADGVTVVKLAMKPRTCEHVRRAGVEMSVRVRACACLGACLGGCLGVSGDKRQGMRAAPVLTNATERAFTGAWCANLKPPVSLPAWP